VIVKPAGGVDKEVVGLNADDADEGIDMKSIK